MAVCFVISVTAMVGTAKKDNYNPAWGPNSRNAYNTAYNQRLVSGHTAGAAFGFVDGYDACKTGLDINSGDSKTRHISTSSTSAQALGKVDGYNDGIDDTYFINYDRGYRECKDNGQQNTGW